MELNEKDQRVLDLVNGGVSSPLEIGAALGFSFARSRDAVCPVLARLVENGLVRKNKHGRFHPAALGNCQK